MRRLRLALAATAVAISALPAAASAAAEDGVRVTTANQGRALESGVIGVRVRVSAESRVELRASAAGTRRLTGGELVRFGRAGSRRALLPLTGAGRSALESASRSCDELVVRVRAEMSAPHRGKPHRESARSELAADESLCQRPSPGPGGGEEPGPGAPPPDPGTNPGPGPGGDVPTEIRAGAATADITPPIGTPMFAYTARSRIADPPQSPEEGMQLIADPAPDENLYAKSFEPSEGIHTRLRASAIVVERGGEKFALVQADLGGIPYGLVQEVQSRIAQTGIPAENLMLSATHSHSGTGPIWPADNAGYNALGGDFFDPRIFELTASGIAEAIVGADAGLEPARVGVGSTQLRGASANRDIDPYRLNGDVAAGESEADAVDHRLTVIRFDAADGTPIGAWSNFAIHGTSFGDGNLLFSGDNMASTERVAEDEISRDAGLPVDPGPPGGDGPVLVWSNAAEGDVRPDGGSPNVDGEPLDYVNSAQANADMAGRKVADGVIGAWRDAGERMMGKIELDARRTIVPIDGSTVEESPSEPVGPLAALGYGGIVGDDGQCGPIPGAPGPLPGQGNKTPIVAGLGLAPQTASLSLWRVGGTAIAAFPFEITTQMGRRITSAVTDAAGGEVHSAIIAGLTNGYLSYTATPEEYQACHYEGSFTLFGHQQGPWLRDGALSLAPSLFDGADAPAGAPEPPELAAGSPNMTPPSATPDAGTATAQPEPAARRYGRATFSWKGGDPAVDAPRGHALVSLQLRSGDGWRTVGTEDGPEDITVWDDEAQTWSETWQFDECDPLGTYRFHVSGRAIRSGGGEAEDYELDSQTFELGPMEPLEVIDAVVDGEIARVRARYPGPGPALLALPRRVADGSATISLAGGGEVEATPDSQGLAFEATVPAGSEIDSVSVTDACGNSTG
jgi:neutral ceramidase